MARDTLYLLKAGFEDMGKPWFCPDCAMMEGYLAYYPQLREALDVVHVDYPRPRGDIAQRIGEANQGCPVLILAEPAEGEEIQHANGASFLSDARPITRYLAAKHDLAPPHP